MFADPYPLFLVENGANQAQVNLDINKTVGLLKMAVPRIKSMADTNKPTIKDVAAMAGVAIGTVSRYLNNLPIREANLGAIEDAIRALDFHKNHFAAAMKTDKSHLVAFLVPEFDEFHSALMQHLMSRLKEKGLVMLIYYHNGDSQAFQEAIRFFRGHRVDALIATGSLPKDSQLDQLLLDGVPVIVYENSIGGLAADEVLVSDQSSSAKAITHLIEMGHERIAIITGNLDHHTGQQRLLGYKNALTAHGLPVNTDYVTGGNWTQPTGYFALQALLQLPAPPTAVFFSSYVLAMGGLKYVREHNLHIPDDLSVISFDDVSVFHLFQPSITAIVQPIAEIAENIAQLLFSRLQNEPNRLFRTVSLPCELVLRESVKRI